MPNYSITNRSIFVGGVKGGVDQDTLEGHFEKFGKIANIKVYAQKCYAFITFEEHEAAFKAIQQKSGIQIEGHTIRCGWGKTSDNFGHKENVAHEGAQHNLHHHHNNHHHGS